MVSFRQVEHKFNLLDQESQLLLDAGACKPVCVWSRGILTGRVVPPGGTKNLRDFEPEGIDPRLTHWRNDLFVGGEQGSSHLPSCHARVDSRTYKHRQRCYDERSER